MCVLYWESYASALAVLARSNSRCGNSFSFRSSALSLSKAGGGEAVVLLAGRSSKCAADARCRFVTMHHEGRGNDWCMNAQWCNATCPFKNPANTTTCAKLAPP